MNDQHVPEQSTEQFVPTPDALEYWDIVAPKVVDSEHEAADLGDTPTANSAQAWLKPRPADSLARPSGAIAVEDRPNSTEPVSTPMNNSEAGTSEQTVATAGSRPTPSQAHNERAPLQPTPNVQETHDRLANLTPEMRAIASDATGIIETLTHNVPTTKGALQFTAPDGGLVTIDKYPLESRDEPRQGMEMRVSLPQEDHPAFELRVEADQTGPYRLQTQVGSAGKLTFTKDLDEGWKATSEGADYSSASDQARRALAQMERYQKIVAREGEAAAQTVAKLTSTALEVMSHMPKRPKPKDGVANGRPIGVAMNPQQRLFTVYDNPGSYDKPYPTLETSLHTDSTGHQTLRFELSRPPENANGNTTMVGFDVGLQRAPDGTITIDQMAIGGNGPSSGTIPASELGAIAGLLEAGAQLQPRGLLNAISSRFRRQPSNTPAVRFTPHNTGGTSVPANDRNKRVA